MSPDRHPCPITGCNGTRKHSQLMCRDCWALVPPGLQRTIWRLFENDQGSATHRAACETAIDHVNRERKDRSMSTSQSGSTLPPTAT
jgi:hypothetical protein